MAKRSRKTRRSKNITKKKEIKKVEEKRINRTTIFLATFVLIIILILVVFYSSFIQVITEPGRDSIRTQPDTIIKPETMLKGEFCERDSHCFITYCKGGSEECVNTTKLSDYSKNCKTYSDWVIERQDSSKCACVQNACKII
ncbi:MAG: hypothetical protein GTN36_03915 [Candidatus Aenigmarchaeota archaeon]|nr:hypothetical protein [Candidatus Aenigmarchaeota archaeon]